MSAYSVIANLQTINGVEFSNNLRSLLVKSEAVIAGGFVLGSIRDTLSETSDVDIYVNETNCQELIRFLGFHGEILSPQVCGTYGDSFFGMNGILARIAFVINKRQFDVIIVREEKEVKDVVSNFDFTFCEVWFDGEKVDGTNINDAIKGVGSMRAGYVKLLLAGNRQTKARLNKYIEKGFDISINPSKSELADAHDKRNSCRSMPPNVSAALMLLRRLAAIDRIIFVRHPDLFTTDLRHIFHVLDIMGKELNITHFTNKVVSTLFSKEYNQYKEYLSMTNYRVLIRDLMGMIPDDKIKEVNFKYEHSLKDINYTPYSILIVQELCRRVKMWDYKFDTSYMIELFSRLGQSSSESESLQSVIDTVLDPCYCMTCFDKKKRAILAI